MSRSWVAFLSFFALVGCQFSSEEVYMNALDGNWEKNNIQKFQFEVKDTHTPKNIIFVVRNNNDYPFTNLRVFGKIYKKGTKPTTTDTLNYILAKPNGGWLGKGFGDTKEILFQYKTGTALEQGQYVVEVQQAMRKDTLVGIEDIGIKIELAKP
ncbi:MAG: gliding motility lipoprotein GldH [Bergeyella zoohelcum]|nr:gliding motility lipoprotein GldH [Bergeyella zoohelcum]